MADLLVNAWQGALLRMKIEKSSVPLKQCYRELLGDFLKRNFDCALKNNPIFCTINQETLMPKYIIEREIPGAGSLAYRELQDISQKSCGILSDMGTKIQWVESYVTDDKVYCVYIAPNEETVREHAEKGGFPANRISQIRSMIDPTTAE